MTKDEINKRIYLSGRKQEYQVHHDMPGSAIVCYVASTKIGNAIVRALRELAYADASTITAPREIVGEEREIWLKANGYKE